MPNRYFFPDPTVTGPLQFFAGLGQRRQQVADMDVAMQSEQNRLLGRGMGDVVSGFVGAQADAQKIAVAHQNRMAIQEAYNAGRVKLEDVRSANAAYEYQYKEFVDRHGSSPEAVFEQMQVAQMARPAAAPQGAPQPGGMRPIPVQGEAQPEPPRTYQPQDPSHMAEYKKRQQTAQSLSIAAEEALEVPDGQERDQRLMQILPALARAQKAVRAMEKKPQTYAEKLQGETAIHNGVIWYPDKDGVDKPFMPPRSVTEAPPWVGIQDMEAHFNAHHHTEPDGSEFLWQGGQWEPLKKDETLPGEAYDEAFKLLSAGKELPPEHKDVLKHMENRASYEEMKRLEPAHNALMQRGNELDGMAARGEAHPAALLEWANKAAATYGTKDYTKWPDDAEVMAKRLAALYTGLVQGQRAQVAPVGP